MSAFDILDEITSVETIAAGGQIPELSRLNRQYGSGKWRKMKGQARIRLKSERVVRAEIH